MIEYDKPRHPWLPLLLSDFCAVVIAYYTTILFRLRSDAGVAFFRSINRLLGIRDTGEVGPIFEAFYLGSAFRIIVQLTIVLCVLYALLNLYAGDRFIRRRPVAWHVLLGNVVALGVFFAYFYLRRNVFHPRSFILTVLALNVFLCVLFRRLIEVWSNWLRQRKGIGRCACILAGNGRGAEELARLIEPAHPHGLFVKARLELRDEETFAEFRGRLEALCREQAAQLLVLADETLSVEQIMTVLELGEQLCLPVKVLSPRVDVLVRNAHLPADVFRGVPLVHFALPPDSKAAFLLRRIVDVAVSGAATVLLLPLIGLIVLGIRLTSRGAALFAQERIGVNRQPFTIYKFRTMYDRAEEMLAQVEEFNEAGTGLFKIKDDPRITPVGRLLRRFSLDELPQLVNVLKGEMTLVGPRPLPRRDFEQYYEEWHYSRHGGLPGLTCLWQVSGRSELDFHTMCILDIYYLRNRNWILDVKIAFKTIWVVLFAKGAY